MSPGEISSTGKGGFGGKGEGRGGEGGWTGDQCITLSGSPGRIWRFSCCSLNSTADLGYIGYSRVFDWFSNQLFSCFSL